MGTTGFEHCDVRSFQPVCKYNPLTMGLSHQREGIPKYYNLFIYSFSLIFALRVGLEPTTHGLAT